MTRSTGRKREFPRSMDLRERFEANVPSRPAIGCWIWTGSKMKVGYGQISEGSRGRQKNHYAHVLAYQLHIGPVPIGQEVEHICEVKACVRWETDLEIGTPHLRATTHKENMHRSRMRIGWGEYQRRRRAR